MGGGGAGGLEPPRIAKLPINEARIASLFEHPFTSAPLPVSSSYAFVIIVLKYENFIFCPTWRPALLK